MKIRSQIKFCKRMACPSAEMLLSYQKESLDIEQKARVVLHLNLCDFCRAELHFLSRHKIEDVNCLQTTDVPAHLYLLVEALLKRNSMEKTLSHDDIYEGEIVS